jgi:hypothetical protein
MVSFWCSRKHNGIALGMYRASENLMHFTNPEHSIMCQPQRRGQDKAFGSTVLVVYGNKPSCGTARSVGICNVGGFRRDDGDPTRHFYFRFLFMEDFVIEGSIWANENLVIGGDVAMQSRRGG